MLKPFTSRRATLLRLLPVAFITFCSVADAVAATSATPAIDGARDNMQTMRARILEHPLELSASLNVPSLKMQFEPTSENSKVGATSLKPNAQVLWGIGVDYQGYGGTLSLPMPRSRESTQQKGSTDHTDLRLHRYWSASGIEFYFKSYKGFYKTNESQADSSDEKQVFDQHPDVHALHTGADYYHVFSPDKYRINLQARDLSNSHIMPANGGSFLAMVSVDHNTVNARSPFLRIEDGGGAIDPHDLILSGEFLTATVGGGYGFSQLFGNHFLRGQLLIGYGPQQQKLYSLDQTLRERTMTGSKVSFLFDYAFPINAGLFGMNLKYDTLKSSLGPYEMKSSVTAVLIYAMWRI